MTSWESIAIGSRKGPLPNNFDIAEVSMCRGSRHAGEFRCRLNQLRRQVHREHIRAGSRGVTSCSVEGVTELRR